MATYTFLFRSVQDRYGRILTMSMPRALAATFTLYEHGIFKRTARRQSKAQHQLSSVSKTHQCYCNQDHEAGYIRSIKPDRSCKVKQEACSTQQKSDDLDRSVKVNKKSISFLITVIIITTSRINHYPFLPPQQTNHFHFQPLCPPLPIVLLLFLDPLSKQSSSSSSSKKQSG